MARKYQVAPAFLFDAEADNLPPLIITEDQIGEIIEKVVKVIRATA